jgi:hypothetical protein
VGYAALRQGNARYMALHRKNARYMALRRKNARYVDLQRGKRVGSISCATQVIGEYDFETKDSSINVFC